VSNHSAAVHAKMNARRVFRAGTRGERESGIVA
jgi:hypothetical protein